MARPSPLLGLSARLLVLTVFFVMLAEIFIYAPSAGRFRLVYLQDSLASAHLASLALDATPEGKVGADLEKKLLHHIGAYEVLIGTEPNVLRMLGGMPPEVDAVYDLRQSSFFPLIWEALRLLVRTENRVLQVDGDVMLDPYAAESHVRVVAIIDEAPMRAELIGYSWRILQLSIIISLFTATLVYISLQWLMVRPIGRLTDAMVRFREAPEDPTRIVEPSARRDEIGTAERELAGMQQGLRDALAQRARLAALGEAVAKINHDLRNILATAQLVSDRLAQSADPEVRRLTPTLLGAIDRAVGLCGEVLHLARIGYLRLASERVPLRAIVEEAGDAILASPRASGEKIGMVWRNEVSPEIAVQGDRAQLTRVLDNLGRNAFEAGATTVTITAETTERFVLARIRDDGPGLPEAVRTDLFRPFAASMRGGSGLGMAIARELVVAQSGSIKLERTGPEGTEIVVVLPAARRHG